jgi:TolB-like protein
MELANLTVIGEINAQLYRILGSNTFKSSPTLSKFLEFIVSETVNNRNMRIKEYSIAVNVLNRPSDFDPHVDAVVRIHAGRLRRALNEYYLTDGIHDAVNIRIPKGCYVPLFNFTEKVKPITPDKPVDPAFHFNPVVAVFPFRASPKLPDVDLFSRMLGEELCAELSRFRDISVIGYYSADMLERMEENMLEAAKLLGADYIITGSLQYFEQNVRIRAILLIASTGEILMTRSLEKRNLFSGLPEIQDEIIQDFISSVGGYYEVLFQEMKKASPKKTPGSPEIHQAFYYYYLFRRRYTTENYLAAVSALEQMVKEQPDQAVAWAMLGELYLEGRAIGLKKGDDPLSESHRCSMQSFKLDQLCQHAWYTYTWVQLNKGEKELCLEAGRKCIQVNPNHTALVSGVGCLFVCAGYFEEGFLAMERSVKLNAFCPSWVSAGICLYYLQREDYAAAYLAAEKINAEEMFLDPLLKCVSLSFLSREEAALKYLEKLLQWDPDIKVRIRMLLSGFILSEKLTSAIFEGLRRIGFHPVADQLCGVKAL